MDKCEQIVKDALNVAKIKYVRELDTETHMDFYLPDFDLHIEVKQFHSDRIAAQMARAPNVIAAQGYDACVFLARAIAGIRQQPRPGGKVNG